MCSRLFQARGRVARYLFDVHDGRTFLDQEGGEHDGFNAVRKEVQLSLVQMSARLSLTKSALRSRIDGCDVSDARVMTATVLIVIEGSANCADDLLPSDNQPSFDESLSSFSRRTHELGIPSHVRSIDRLVIAPPSANQGSE